MSSNYYHGMVETLRDFMNLAIVGLGTASYEGAGFQSLNMIMDGGSGGS